MERVLELVMERIMVQLKVVSPPCIKFQLVASEDGGWGATSSPR